MAESEISATCTAVNADVKGRYGFKGNGHDWCKKHYVGILNDDNSITPCACECHKDH